MATGVKAAAFAALVRVLLEAFPSAESALAAGHRRRSPSRRWWWATWSRWPAIAQADAGLQLDRPRGLPAGGGVARDPDGRGRGAAVSRRLRPHHARQLRIPGGAGPRRRAGRDATTTSPGWPPARPWIALGLGVCMLSLLGFPGTFGFIGKWYILSAVIAEGQVILAGGAGAHQRGLGGLLSAGHHGDVHEARAGRGVPRGRFGSGPAPRRRRRALGRRGAAVRRLARGRARRCAAESAADPDPDRACRSRGP